MSSVKNKQTATKQLQSPIGAYISAGAQFLMVILAFIPGFYVHEQWLHQTEYIASQRTSVPVDTLVSRSAHSLFDGVFNTYSLPMMVGFALFAAMLCGTICCVLRLIAKGDSQYKKPILAASVFQSVLLAAYAVLVSLSDHTYLDTEDRYFPHAVCYVMAAACITLIAVNLFGHRSKAD